MLIDRVTEQIRKKKNPCMVGLDPEWEKLPDCYKDGNCPAPEAVLGWARDIIDALADLLVAVRQGKGLFVLVKTSNPGSVEISEARNGQGQKLSDWLAE